MCTGWHALCSASFDCRVNGETADCNCMRVDEPHLVLTSEIQDPVVKRQTQTKCTNEDPCDTDQAPVCKAFKDGQYRVDHVRYDWVSTFSYRGWCSILEMKPQPCDQQENGYVGDANWAICDGAPCTENENPADPDKPLVCRCRVEDGPFIGINGSCTGEGGGIMSSSPMETWDFQANSYLLPLPRLGIRRGRMCPVFPPISRRHRRNSESHLKTGKACQSPGERQIG